MRRQLLKTTAVISSLTLVEKGIAAARHVVLAALFGAGAAMDALVVGVSVADLAVALLTGSFLAVFIPLHARWRAESGDRVADQRSLNLMGSISLLLMAAAAGLAVIGSRIAGWVGVGFGPEQRDLIASLMPWLAMFVWSSGTAVLVTGLYYSRGRFRTPQVAQMLQRLVSVMVLVFLARRFGLRAAAISIAVGGLALLAVLVLGAARRRGWPRPTLAPAAPEVRGYFMLFLPLLAGALIDQAVLFTDRAMASTLAAGGVSALYYASVAWGIPVLLLCQNFSTVLFPTLASDMAGGDMRRVGQSIEFGMKSMILVMIGATALMVALAPDLVALLFRRGEFDAAAVALTGRALLALSLCLVFQGVGTIANLVLYAAHRTGTVALCGVVRVTLNVILNALLMRSYGATGIALSTSITLAAWFCCVAWPLRAELRRRAIAPHMHLGLSRLLPKVLGAGGLAGGAAWLVAGWPALAGEEVWRVAARLAAGGSAGLGIYAGLLWLLRLPEAAAAARVVTTRLGWRGAAT